MKRKLLLLALLAPLFTANAQLVTSTTLTPVELINTLCGLNEQVFNVKFNGTSANANTVSLQASAFFTGINPTNLGLTDGIVLATGRTTVAYGPNNNGGASTPVFPTFNSDPDLAMLTTQVVVNTALLEFDFVAQGNILTLDFIFASEEYPEWINAAFNDVVGIFVSGPGINGPFTGNAKNIAVIPYTAVPVALGTVNNGLTNTGPCQSCAYYVSNGIGITPIANTTIQYDGFTVPITAETELIAGQLYHIKLAVANVGDNSFDSALFFKSNTFSTVGDDEPVNCELQDQCIYTFTLADNGGNGLNGNYMTVFQNSQFVGDLYDEQNTGNSSFDFQVPLCDGQPFDLFWEVNGTHPEEISVTIKNPFNQTIYNKPAGEGSPGTLLYNGLTNCITPLKTITFVKTDFELAPNPARNTIEIRATDEKIASVTLYDITGKIAKKFTNLDTLVFVADLSNVARGFYTVAIETDRGDRTVKKLILE